MATTETTETAAVDIRPRTITPYLTAKDAGRAIEFYRQAFGATETYRMEDDTGRIGHAEIDIAGIVVMLSDEHPELGIVSPETLGGAGLGLTLPSTMSTPPTSGPSRPGRRVSARRRTSSTAIGQPPCSTRSATAGPSLARSSSSRSRIWLSERRTTPSPRPSPATRPPLRSAIDPSASWATSRCRCPTSTERPRSTAPSSDGGPSRPGRAPRAAAISTATCTTPSLPLGFHDQLDDRRPPPLLPGRRSADGGRPGARARRRGARGVRLRVRRQCPLPRRPRHRVRPLAGGPGY